ncbi:MAG: protein phosphatase 2C domain-containing protein [Anaerolineae bacterium]|jgi:protein phosphatase
MQLLRRLLLGEAKPTGGLAPSPEPPSVHIRSKIEVGWATDVGKTRDHNEDTALVITAAHDGDDMRPSFGLFVLADGMGGHRAGELASSLAARVAAYHIARHVYLPSLIDREHDLSQPALTEILVDAIQAANDAVSKQVPGGGTTLTCALVLGTQAYIGHVGDSRAYVLTEERLEQITHDHSLVGRLIESGQLTRDEAAVHPQKHVLYRAVGQSGPLEVDAHVRKIPLGDHLLLCSDGLWEMVDDAVIIDLITGASSRQEACEGLIAAANEAGGRDNTTAILWRCPLG